MWPSSELMEPLLGAVTVRVNSEVQAVAPVGALVTPSQVVHTSEPVVLAYVPPGQSVQEEEPAMLKRPAAQGLCELEPSAQELPAGHSVGEPLLGGQ